MVLNSIKAKSGVIVKNFLDWITTIQGKHFKSDGIYHIHELILLCALDCSMISFFHSSGAKTFANLLTFHRALELEKKSAILGIFMKIGFVNCLDRPL